MNTAVLGRARGRSEDAASAASIGLWLFIGVASSLFSLFVTAYAMRMDGAADWSPIGMPWQLWLSSALLVAGSVALEQARRSSDDARRMRRLLLVGGGCAAAFVLAQLWGWQALHSARVVLAGNPAASFFYLLTAMHGLHVIGGLAGWAVAWNSPSPWRVALCARYWHFLLAAWAVLFAALGWLTPEVVAFICGRG